MDGRAGIIDFDIYDEGDYAHIIIRDNGKGIGINELPHIFERFYRTDSSRNSKKGGSGIGLAIGNACVALSGAVIGQSMSFFDVGYGSGMVVVGLASVIIGETIMGRHGVTVGLISAVVGSCLYRMFIAAALKVDLFPAYSLKLISAVIVIIALAIPTLQKKLGSRRHKGGASRC